LQKSPTKETLFCKRDLYTPHPFAPHTTHSFVFFRVSHLSFRISHISLSTHLSSSLAYSFFLCASHVTSLCLFPSLSYIGWLRLVGSFRSKVIFAKEPYKKDYILQKRPIILRSLLIVATPYLSFRAFPHLFEFLTSLFESPSYLPFSACSQATSLFLVIFFFKSLTSFFETLTYPTFRVS